MDTEAQRSTPIREWELPGLWLAVQIFFTVITCVHTFFSVFSVASCTETSCDYAAFSAAVDTSYAGAFGLLVATVIAMILLRGRPRPMVWAPITGTVLLIVLQVATYVAGRAALTLPLFGNRLPGCW